MEFLQGLGRPKNPEAAGDRGQGGGLVAEIEGLMQT